MDDLISRQAAIDVANDWLLDCMHVKKQDRSCGLIRRLEDLPSAQPEINCSEFPNNSDTISRQAAIDAVYDAFCYAYCDNCEKEMNEDLCGDCHRKYQNWSASKKIIEKVINNLPSAQPDLGKYEYHYDHTDCIWYRPEARNRCPVTCAQYRDGWNDAMNYIFCDGEGYRPFRRDKKYEG